MLDKQLAELEAAEKAATPGPWMPSAECESIIAAEDSIYGLGVADCDAERLNGSSGRPWREEQPNNIAIITTFRNASPQFIALAKAAQRLDFVLRQEINFSLPIARIDTGLIKEALGVLTESQAALSAALPSVKEGK